eukprot:gb/GECG01014228.1/.p1 GENE.gb/GECG01014228.1/~~gb/GECG01014228.1/.p1  ORF type:complete len:560 (+),score=72.27 gb/GECG01014228.1/:1-1680(+)
MYSQSNGSKNEGKQQASAASFDYVIPPSMRGWQENGLGQQAVYPPTPQGAEMDSGRLHPPPPMNVMGHSSAGAMGPPPGDPRYGAMGYYFPAHQGPVLGDHPATQFMPAPMELATSPEGDQERLVYASRQAGGKKVKREQVKRACVPCSAAKRKCDHQRPCKQCIKRNLQDSCSDVKPRKRNRASNEEKCGIRDDDNGESARNSFPDTTPKNPSLTTREGARHSGEMELQKQDTYSAKTNSYPAHTSASGTACQAHQDTATATSAEHRQILAVKDLSHPVTRIRYTGDSFVIRCIFMNKAASLLFGTVAMSPEDLNGLDMRWVHPDDEPERLQSYSMHLMRRECPKEDIPFYSNLLKNSPATIPRSTLNGSRRDSIDCPDILSLKAVQETEKMIDQSIRPWIPPELTCTLECLFRGKFFRFFRRLTEEEAAVRASDANVTIDGEPTARNPFAEFHVFKATICSFFVRNKDLKVVGSYDVAIDVKPEEEIFVMPEYFEHFVDGMLEVNNTWDSTYAKTETSSSKDYTSRFSNQYVLLVESEYAQTDEGKLEYGALLSQDF